MRRPKWQASAWVARAQEETGQTMAEYATLLGVLIIAVVVAVTALSLGIDAKLQNDLTTILSGM
jgi:Flp pilus assembly pilin Flp